MEKFVQSFGAIPSKKDIRDYVAHVSAPVDLPKEFELELCAVKNQGSTGSCVAHSVSEVVEYFNKIQEGEYVRMSTGYIYGNRSSYTGSGMYVSEALYNTVKYGDVPNTLFSSNAEVPKAIEEFEKVAFELAPDAFPNRFSSYFRLYTEQAVKVNLIQNGPVVFAMPWYNDIYVKDGVMQHDPTKTTIAGHHCMVIYGWNEIGWKIQNSWGTYWGNSGKAILPYEIPFSEAYGVIDEISDTLTKKKIEQLEKSNQDYANRLLELNTTLTSLREAYELKEQQIKEAQELYQKIEEQLKLNDVAIEHLEADKRALDDYIKQLTSSYDELKRELTECQEEKKAFIKSIEEQKKTIEVLEKKILDIEKPYENWNSVIVKIINWIINLFKKKED
jgi:hypothetical protein